MLFKQKVCIFANKGIKEVARCGKGNLVEVRMERDLFGSIFCLALKRKINKEEVLTYPLTAILRSLCHVDGKMSKTTKSTLWKNLRSQVPQIIQKWLMWLSLRKCFSSISSPIHLKH